MKIVFFGASRFVIPVIEELCNSFDLVLVVTTEQKDSDPVPVFCIKNNIPFISAAKFDDSLKVLLRKTHAPIAVLASFGIFLPTEVLNIFSQGILNIHPSLLPLYRGPTPVQSAILHGDEETGVTIIKLDEEMDHGPILGQEKEVIFETDTAESLMEKLFRKGAKMIEEIIPGYLSGKVKLRAQDEDLATYTQPTLSRQDGFIDSENPPAKVQLDRMIRAYFPWPGVWSKFRIQNSEFRIKGARVFGDGCQELRVKFLPENKIQVEGGKPMTYKDFYNGYPYLKDATEKIIAN
jgi:methionyl-tRNA formyltransferase